MSNRIVSFIKAPLRFIYNLSKCIYLHLMASGFFEVSIKDCDDSSYAFMIFGKAFLFNKKGLIRRDNRMDSSTAFYLKVNRLDENTILCVQHWLDVVSLTGRDFYIVCDNPLLKKYILSKCAFESMNIKFLRSMRRRLRPIAKNLYTHWWGNAALAHMTPFYHSLDNDYEKHWDIDADDMIFLLEDKKILDILMNVERITEEENLNAMSLDVHNSRSNGVHWSLGILFVNDNASICLELEKETSTKWMNSLADYDHVYNLDWYFTYLRNSKALKLSSFYVENAYFIHWGSFLTSPIGCGIYFWRKGKLIDKIIDGVFNNEEIGIRSMVDSYCIDIDLDGTEGCEFWLNYIWNVNNQNQFRKKYWLVDINHNV